MVRWSILLAVVATVAAVLLGMVLARLSSSGQGGDISALQIVPSAATGTAVATATRVATTTLAVTASSAATGVGVATASPVVTATAVVTATRVATATLAVTATTTSSGGEGSAFVEYTVERGDTLKQIAEAYGVTMAEILALNDISDPDSLAIGEVLRIPSR